MEENKNEIGKFIDPDDIIAQLDIEKGATVADFGCGPGYFSLPFAKAVGDDGKLYALDVLPQTLETVIGKIKNSGLANVITKRVNLEKENGSKLETESVDWVVMKDVLFQNQKKEIIISEAYRILKIGGKAIVVEWDEKESPIGPQTGLRISRNVLKNMFLGQKFSIEKDVGAGDFHYAFVVIKK
jgi:ubiquinone/menaquinone biosynthesis C-methylase UbiE